MRGRNFKVRRHARVIFGRREFQSRSLLEFQTRSRRLRSREIHAERRTESCTLQAAPPNLTSFGMCLVVDAGDVAGRKLSVALRGRKPFVPEKLLDGAQ